MAGGGGAKADGVPEITLEHTPTWIVASVCSVIVVISLLFERLLHRLGKVITTTNDRPPVTLTACTVVVDYSIVVH